MTDVIASCVVSRRLAVRLRERLPVVQQAAATAVMSVIRPAYDVRVTRSIASEHYCRLDDGANDFIACNASVDYFTHASDRNTFGDAMPSMR